MGVDFRSIAADAATTSFPVAPGSDDQITVTYRPSVLTTEWMNDGRALVESMTEVIESWDLLDGSDPYPIERDALSKLPLTFLGYLLSKLLQDMTTGKASRSGTSANGSSAGVSGGGGPTS